MNVKNCQRCNKETNGVTIMSMFNTQIICKHCKEAETKSPRYEEAAKADNEEIRKGNYNFKGIGLRFGLE